jgi:hypothetical protein
MNTISNNLAIDSNATKQANLAGIQTGVVLSTRARHLVYPSAKISSISLIETSISRQTTVCCGLVGRVIVPLVCGAGLNFNLRPGAAENCERAIGMAQRVRQRHRATHVIVVGVFDGREGEHTDEGHGGGDGRE